APQDVPDMGNFVVYQQLGLTYNRLGDWEKCAAAGRRLQQLTPDQAMGYQLVGNAYFSLHRYPDAAVQLVAGLIVDPGNKDSWNNVTVVYKTLGVEPNPVIQQGGAMSLNSQMPVVREHISSAARIVVHQLEDAKQLDRAQELRDQFIKDYALSPELFRR